MLWHAGQRFGNAEHSGECGMQKEDREKMFRFGVEHFPAQAGDFYTWHKQEGCDESDFKGIQVRSLAVTCHEGKDDEAYAFGLYWPCRCPRLTVRLLQAGRAAREQFGSWLPSA
jgi:hypothetical protein